MNCSSDNAITLYVSTVGNDNWSGYLSEANDTNTDGPMATIEGVLKKLRFMKLRGEVSKPVNVWIRGGRYEISKPIILRPEDSTAINFCAYSNENPIIDGGRKLSGWNKEKVNGIDMWTLELPEVELGKWYFRQLFVNNERRSRTRLPKQGFYWMKDVPGIDINKSSWDQFMMGTDRFIYEEGHMKKWRNLQDVDVVVPHFWVDERMPAEYIDEEKRMFVSSLRSFFVLMDDEHQRFCKYYIENTFEGLSEKGEWYLDRRKGKVFYIPMEGETFENTEIYAPYVSEFLRLEGEPENNKFIDNIRFEGITFIHSDWYNLKWELEKNTEQYIPPQLENIQKKCASSPQSAINVPGSLFMKGARNCVIENCKIYHSGFYGIELNNGCKSNRLAHNEINDIGAGGIKINGSSKAGEENLHSSCNEVFSNHIHNAGNVFVCGVGILLQHGYKNRVRHNLIHDLYYSGISCGWVWRYGDNISRENLIENNHIYNLGKKVMSDMGGIYTLGIQPGTIIRGNFIHDIESCNYGGWGIYLDEGSSFIVVENNIVLRTNSQSFHLHFGRENIVRNNIFGFASEGQLRVGKKYAPGASYPIEFDAQNSATFERNIVLSKGGKFHSFAPDLSPKDYGYICISNIYWDINIKEEAKSIFAEVKTKENNISYYSFEEWQGLGYDMFSVYGDPSITFSDKDIYTIDSQSPAFKIGFKKIDVSQIGLSNNY